MDVTDVAAALGCSESSVKKLVGEGKLRKPRHILRSAVWFEADVDEYLRRLDRGDFEEEENEPPEPKPAAEKPHRGRA